jgi:hypothetical protein
VDELRVVMGGSKRGDAVARFVGTEPLLPIAVVSYRRTAFEWTGLRVTIDRSVRFHEPEGVAPGRLLGELSRSIVEVKRDGALPEWLVGPLKGRRAKGFSKSKRALALLRPAAAAAP